MIMAVDPGITFKTDPFEHQLEEFLSKRARKAHGRLWEMGTGKSKTTLDETAWLFIQGEVNGLFIVAPNGVHRNWAVEEIPRHLPDDVAAVTVVHWYSSDKHNSLQHRMQLERLMNASPEKLVVLVMSYDSLMTEHGRKVAKDFLTKRRCMYVLDESRRIANPTAKRTKRVLASAPYAAYRRILNGTPISNGPFDLYEQIRFLDPDFWVRHGITSFAGFKVQFADFKPIKVAGGRIIQVVDSYKNLDTLSLWLKEISTRVTKDDVLDLPPKVFSMQSFELTSQQRRIYDQLRDEYLTMLDGGELVTAPLAITRILRLQQITCGYLPTDGTNSVVDIPGGNPRLELLKEMCDDTPHQAIIWSRFRRDIDKICSALGSAAVRYDGMVDEDGRALAIERFQKVRDAQFFVGNPAAAGEGLTLHAARTVYHYANSCKLAEHLQAEDRAHRIGQEHPVDYRHLCATGTVDRKICDNLSRKLDVASQLTGDSLRDWLA